MYICICMYMWCSALLLGFHMTAVVLQLVRFYLCISATTFTRPGTVLILYLYTNKYEMQFICEIIT